MKLFRHIALILAALALLALLPGSASAARGNDVIRDCNEDSDLDGNYSEEDLREAEENLPSDIDEYTDCRQIIRDARLRNRSGGGGGGAGGAGGAGGGFGGGGFGGFAGSALDAATPEDRAALGEATRDRGDSAREAAAVTLDGERVAPGGDGTFTAARTAANELPLPVLVALICVALLVAMTAIAGVDRRWPQLRHGPLRLLRR